MIFELHWTALGENHGISKLESQPPSEQASGTSVFATGLEEAAQGAKGLPS